MKVCLIYNASDPRCGFRNFGDQTAIALARAGCFVTTFDGSYPAVYLRHQQALPSAFFPPDIETYDVVHLIWNAMTMNHYSGAGWPHAPVISWWDGGPSDATCPFTAAMQVRWSAYPREGYHYLWYPVPDWVTDLPAPTLSPFTVGMSSVRGDGVPLLQILGARWGWALNLPDGTWRSIGDEVRRLARSTINVCWYHTAPIWRDRASAPSMLLASGRPLLINADPLTAHLQGRADIYQQPYASGALDMQCLEDALRDCDARRRDLRCPTETAHDLSWTVATTRMLAVWQEAIDGVQRLAG